MAEHGGDAEAALEALPQIAAKAGVAGYRPCPPEVVERELAAGSRAGARPIFIGMKEYPSALAEIADAPPMLWALGQTELTGREAVALVGARNASSIGRRTAAALSRGLGEAGLVVVSGLARGIDAEAHAAALATGTIAVVAGGVDVVYPKENTDLTARIAETGLIVSEMPPGTRPQARHFPRRNRIISGIARAVLVVEAATKSGSLITARDALDQGRDVLAVPGHPFDGRASGCNLLIRDGATLVRNAEDVLEALGTAPAPRLSPRRERQPTPAAQPADPPRINQPAAAAPTHGDPLRNRILSFLGMTPLSEDQLLRDLCMPAPAIAEELLALEMDGAVVRHPGGLLARGA
ncbi:DNA protecting protein DprA [Tropicimonas sediminicola]|uniref:DNA protecting protein DprA n=2 Tax=Tropicimonas sediminicola TaxID=1031541 RepID=A0A239KII4_9RHOB|nr:DNA protecting protein DprA [Tropicimonas sediminicola]